MNLPMNQSHKLVLKTLRSHPSWFAVQIIYNKLSSQGYKIFLAGGCVRDALLGVLASDIDIASDATPDQIEHLFEKTINVGKIFGVMRVLVEGQDIEVATFRNDGKYVDGRHPKNITFSSAEEDAKRRDFTINALFFDLKTEQVLDYIEGQKDLDAGLIKTVGQASERFQEDHLRLLRGARFAAQLGFSVEAETLKAMTDLKALVNDVSGERLRDEIGKLMKSKAPSVGLFIMSQTGLMQQLFSWWKSEFEHPLCESLNKKTDLESWQRWSLFFRAATVVELKAGLDLLKFSSKERKHIEEAWGLWSHVQDFLVKRLGFKLQSLEKNGVHWALQVLNQDGFYTSEIQFLFQRRKQLGEALPKAFLGGDDIKGLLKGEKIRICLQEAYFLQLEGHILNRDMALNWLLQSLPNYKGT